jgi:hypothetical protein
MSKTIILGGGISGLVALNYTPGAVLYERNKLPAIDLTDDTFPKYIHSNFDTVAFCSDIGVVPKIVPFKIGIYYRRKIHDFFTPVLTQEECYSLYGEYCVKKYGKLEVDKMNGFISGRREECYISNKNEIVEKLFKKNHERIHLDSKVTEINTRKKYIVVNGEQEGYDNLISTLPIHIFSELSSVQCPVDFMNLKCVLIEAEMKSDISQYNFIYVVDEHYRFSRVNLSLDKQRYVFEFPTTHTDENDCYQFCDEFKVKPTDHSFMKGYSFPRLLSPIVIDYVRFVGRFAVGDYTMKTEDVIKEFRSEPR